MTLKNLHAQNYLTLLCVLFFPPPTTPTFDVALQCVCVIISFIFFPVQSFLLT